MIRPHHLTVRQPLSDDPYHEVVGDGRSQFINGLADVVVLIHGYGTREEDAEKSYEGFLDSIDSSVDVLRPTDYFGFHWPGNRTGAVPMDKLTYSSRVPAATASGQDLGRLVMEMKHKRDRRVTIVCHSLGSRVALACLEVVGASEKHRPRVFRVIMMAAAVGVRECRLNTGQFRTRFPGLEYHVLHSWRDLVLLAPFRAGQRGHSTYAKGLAVGTSGGPKGRWGMQLVNTHLGHEGYWGSTFGVDAFAVANGYTSAYHPAPLWSLREHELPSWSR